MIFTINLIPLGLNSPGNCTIIFPLPVFFDAQARNLNLKLFKLYLCLLHLCLISNQKTEVNVSF